MTTIQSRKVRGQVLYSSAVDTVEEAVEEAISKGVSLRFADLSGVDFRKVKGLRLADIYEARLDGCTVDWNSHALLAEILRKAAGEDYGRRKFAGFVAVSYDWCWPKILEEGKDDAALSWALDVFKSYATEGDGAPDCVTLRPGLAK